MVKTKTIIWIIPAILFGLFLSCNDNDENECISRNIQNVTSIEAPQTGEIGETIIIEVSFEVNNGCGDFGRFIETEAASIQTIEVEALYTGCVCNANVSIITVDYEFTAYSPGEYDLKFKSGEDEYITTTLIID